MPHSSRFTFVAVLSFCVGIVACDKPAAEKSPTANTTSPQPTPSGSTVGLSEKPAASAPAPSASIAAETPPDSILVGTWEGRYEAKKGVVGMPPRVEDKVRSKDDGKTAIGNGTITITIAKDLELSGSSDGVLGQAKLRGKVEGDEVRAAFDPVDVQDKQGMFGIVSGKRKDDQIEAQIRVANGDATIVREANIVLRRKP